jgi:hypothetical protein
MATGAGYAAAYSFESIEDFETDIDTVLAQKGPVFVALKIVPEPDDDRPLPAAGVDVAADARTVQGALSGTAR